MILAEGVCRLLREQVLHFQVIFELLVLKVKSLGWCWVATLFRDLRFKLGDGSPAVYALSLGEFEISS